MSDETFKTVVISAIFNKLLEAEYVPIKFSENGTLTEESQSLMTKTFERAKNIYSKTGEEMRRKNEASSSCFGEFGAFDPKF